MNFWMLLQGSYYWVPSNLHHWKWSKLRKFILFLASVIDARVVLTWSNLVLTGSLTELTFVLFLEPSVGHLINKIIPSKITRFPFTVNRDIILYLMLNHKSLRQRIRPVSFWSGFQTDHASVFSHQLALQTGSLSVCFLRKSLQTFLFV